MRRQQPTQAPPRQTELPLSRRPLALDSDEVVRLSPADEDELRATLADLLRVAARSQRRTPVVGGDHDR